MVREMKGPSNSARVMRAVPSFIADGKLYTLDMADHLGLSFRQVQKALYSLRNSRSNPREIPPAARRRLSDLPMEARVLRAAMEMAARGEPAGPDAVARLAGTTRYSAEFYLAGLRRKGRLPPVRRARPVDHDGRCRVMDAVARRVALGRPVTVRAISADTGIPSTRVHKHMRSLRAWGELPEAGAEPPLAAPIGAKSPPEWPEGRPEEWEPAVACRWYVREWKRSRRAA